ncbi:MAG TPA: hypothetical protein VIH21_09780 [Dehalococcoidia bacterium]|jgi:hypothetical protein
MATTIPGQLLAAIKNRKFTSIAKLYAPGVDFQAWNPSGHWVASDGATVAKIVEVWFTPGANSVITYTNETATARSAMLEFEVTWKLPPEDQPRILRQVHLMTIDKSGRISAARVYCAGLHTEFPEVDLEKQRRAKGLAAPVSKQASAAPKIAVAVRA